MTTYTPRAKAQPTVTQAKAEGWDEAIRAMEKWFEPSSTERMYWPDNPYRKEEK